MDTHRELAVWNRGCRLAVDVHKHFSSMAEPSLRAEVLRTSFTVATQIAGAYEVRTGDALRDHYCRASSACAELRTLIYIAEELDFVESSVCRYLIRETMQLSQSLRGTLECERVAQLM